MRGFCLTYRERGTDGGTASPEEAALAYDGAARSLRGAKAKTNFPPTVPATVGGGGGLPLPLDLPISLSPFQSLFLPLSLLC